MSAQDKPWWDDLYREQQAKARARVEEIIKTSDTYYKPVSSSRFVSQEVSGRVALVDIDTGDRFIVQSVDHERRLLDFRFTTSSGKLVSIFMTQFGGGHYMKWDLFPVRVYHVEEPSTQDREVIEARERISIPRFAEFLAAFPDFTGDSRAAYVVIDAPSSEGERL